MKKLITLSLKDKKTAKKPGVKKWLRATEKVLNKMITPEVLAHVSLGLPIKVREDHIECVYPFEDIQRRCDLRKYVNGLKNLKFFKHRTKLASDIAAPSPYFKMFKRKK